MEIAVYVDVTEICRICLAEKGSVSIFGDDGQDRLLLGYTIAERIMSFACVEVLADDGLPHKLCFKCLSDVDQAFKLKAQCESADATLRELCTDNNTVGNASCFMLEEDTVPDIDIPNALDSPVNIKIENESELMINPEGFLKVDNFSDEDFASSAERNEKSNVSADKEYQDEINGAETSYDISKQQLRKPPLAACMECGEQFLNKKRLETHSLAYPSHKPFQCNICGKRFIRLCNMKEHEKRHGGPKHFLCSNCGQFSTGRKHHYCTEVNDKLSKSYACDICKKKFVSATSLQTHKKRHGTQSKFQCDVCKKLYFSKQELARHVRVHLNIRPFQCSEENCALTFYSRGELNRHLRYHKGIKRFACKLCGQKFFESGHLATHEKKHTGERPFRCRHCPKSFTNSSKLRRHLLCHVKASSRRRGIDSELCSSDINENHQIDIEENIKVIEVTLENSQGTTSSFDEQATVFSENVCTSDNNAQNFSFV